MSELECDRWFFIHLGKKKKNETKKKQTLLPFERNVTVLCLI